MGDEAQGEKQRVEKRERHEEQREYRNIRKEEELDGKTYKDEGYARKR